MKKNRIAIAVFIFFFLYGVVFILHSSFTVSGERHFTCTDDIMIGLNYARNIADGHGYVWYPGGDKVEGTSSPLWVAVMVAAHLILDSDRYTPGLVQLLSLIFLVIGSIWLYRLTMLLTEKKQFFALVTSGVTFFYSALFYWSIMGFEVSLAFALISIVTFEGVRELKLKKSSIWLLCTLFALLILVRNELLVYCVSFLIITKVANIRGIISSKFLICMSTIFFTCLGIVLFRWFLFNEIFPNTYYLKMTGYPLILRMSRGLYVAILFVRDLSLPLLLIYVYGVFTLVRKDGVRVALLLAVPLFMYIAYSIYVGGDAWEYRGGANRWIAPFMGLFVMCTVLGCKQISESASLLFFGKMDTDSPVTLYSTKVLRWVLLFVVFLQMNLCGTNPTNSMMELLMLRKPMGVPELRQQIIVGDVISEITHKEAKIGLIVAGVIPYYTEGRHFVDLYGYNDRIIAKQKGHIRGVGWTKYVSYGPGLVKYDLDYSVGQLQPDVIADLPMHDHAGFEKKFGYLYKRVSIKHPELNRKVMLWLRKDSTKLKTEKLIRMGIFL